jgi:hypothetical protein
MFLAFLIHGLSFPTHQFLRGLLFVYGVQLHQLTPNLILHIACFVTLYESFLGIDPHWVLWKFLFRLHPSVSLDKNPEMGGAVVSVRSESHYLSSTWLPRCKARGKNGSISRTRRPLTLISMVSLLLMPTKA